MPVSLWPLPHSRRHGVLWHSRGVVVLQEQRPRRAGVCADVAARGGQSVVFLLAAILIAGGVLHVSRIAGTVRETGDRR